MTTGEEYGGGKIGQEHLDGYIDGITYYIPSIAPRGILYIYNNNFFPEFRNSILLTSLKFELILLISFEDRRPLQKIINLNGYGRISSLDINQNGEIFFSTNFKSAATVPGLGLKIKEYELINFIFFINWYVLSKSFSSSPG